MLDTEEVCCSLPKRSTSSDRCSLLCRPELAKYHSCKVRPEVLLLRLEEQYRAVSEVEVDEVFRLCVSLASGGLIVRRLLDRTMSNEAAEVPSHDTVPRCTFTFVKLLTYQSSLLWIVVGEDALLFA